MMMFPSFTIRGRRVAPAAGGGGLPAWITNNAPNVGDWYSLPSSNISAAEVASPPPGATGPAAKITAWNSMAVDTDNSIVYQAAGGGHGDYSGNEVDKIELNVASPGWVNVRAPTASVTTADHYSDGRPVSRHQYYGITFDNEGSDRRIILVGGTRYADAQKMSTVDAFNIGSGDWSAAGTLTGGFSSTIYVEEQYPVCRDSRNGNIFAFGSFQVSKWTKATNTWSNPYREADGPPYAAAAYGAASAFDSTRNRFFLLGGAYSARDIYTPDTNAVSTVTLSGGSSGSVASAGAMGMVYIPSLDVFLARQSGSGGTVYQITPTGVCTTFSTSGGASVPSTSNGPYNKFLYVPALKGCIYVPTYTGNMWYLRVEA